MRPWLAVSDETECVAFHRISEDRGGEREDILIPLTVTMETDVLAERHGTPWKSHLQL